MNNVNYLYTIFIIGFKVDLNGEDEQGITGSNTGYQSSRNPPLDQDPNCPQLYLLMSYTVFKYVFLIE